MQDVIYTGITKRFIPHNKARLQKESRFVIIPVRKYFELSDEEMEKIRALDSEDRSFDLGYNGATGDRGSFGVLYF